MVQNSSPSEICYFWQNEIEQNTESGTTSILETGSSDLPSGYVNMLLAYRRCPLRLRSSNAPYMAGGGVGISWLASLLRPVSHYSDGTASEPIVVYGGVGEAEQIASVTQLYAAIPRNRLTSSPRSAIPVSVFEPQSQPALTTSWDVLPFLVANTESPMAVGDQNESESDDMETQPDSLQDWAAWAALLMAVGLIILAVIT